MLRMVKLDSMGRRNGMFNKEFVDKRIKTIKEKYPTWGDWSIGKKRPDLSERNKINVRRGKDHYRFGKKLTEEQRRKISDTRKQRIVEGRIKHPRGMLGKTNKWGRHSEQTKEIIRKKRKCQVFPTFKTKPELMFIEICKNYELPYVFTGDGSFWIENINPDFVNCNGQKICVEVFGSYWHTRPEEMLKDDKKLKVLKKYGWKRIILWEDELKNLSEKDIVNKIYGGEKIGNETGL